MTKTIETLVEDINCLLEHGFPQGEVPEELCEEYGKQFAELLKTRLVREAKTGLRMSNIGKPCERQLYYDINSPELGEKLRPETYAKFLFGDMVELLLLFLAEASGHKVEGTQDTQEISGIKGHRDAVIDGMVIDVKSASTYSFNRFKNGELAENDSFGYIGQIQSYLYAAQDDPIVTEKDRAGFLVFDKTLGHICLDIHEKDGKDYEEFFESKKKMVNQPDPPERAFEPEPDGKSGNLKLGVNCSYCSFNSICWPEARTFLYYNGPRKLVKVVSEPRVPEIFDET